MKDKIGSQPVNSASWPAKDDILRQFDVSFIHQVLLTDGDRFSDLVDGKGQYTLSFREFLDDSHMDQMDRDMVLQRSIRDRIAEKLSRNSDDLAPLHGLLLELHQQLRALIPNRKDLHPVLEDESVENAHSIHLLRPLVVKAALSLERLESESRAVTTRELLLELRNPTDNSPMFWVTAIVYLLYKTELCQRDKQDFYLVHVWAPRIHQEGPDLERQHYQEKFGSFSDPEASPRTRQWIQSLIQSQQRTSGGNPQCQESDSECSQSDSFLTRLLESDEERRDLIRKGWIEDIVFRSSHQQSLNMPEVFLQDAAGLHQIREVTRLAVAGCALALHAGNAAGAQQDASNDRKLAMLKAMMTSGTLRPETYEERVVAEVVALAQEWNPDGVIDSDSLRGRVVAVLRGEDPVLQLLNTRISVAVREVVLEKLHCKSKTVAPTTLRTGFGKDGKPSKGPLTDLSVIEKLFCRRGLSFFAAELAFVAERAGRIVDLAVDLYWDGVLDKLVLDQCNEAIAFALD